MPTEEFRFQSSSIKNVQMNGDARYTGGSMNLPAYNETFNGSARGTRAFATTGSAGGKRIDVSADYGIVWQISERFHLADQFSFLNFREPTISNLSEIDQLGTSLLLPPRSGAASSHNHGSYFSGNEDRNQHADCDLGCLIEGQHITRVSLSETRCQLGHASVSGSAAERDLRYIPDS